jgi:hypothetical protein
LILLRRDFGKAVRQPFGVSLKFNVLRQKARPRNREVSENGEKKIAIWAETFRFKDTSSGTASNQPGSHCA